MVVAVVVVITINGDGGCGRQQPTGRLTARDGLRASGTLRGESAFTE